MCVYILKLYNNTNNTDTNTNTNTNNIYLTIYMMFYNYTIIHHQENNTAITYNNHNTCKAFLISTNKLKKILWTNSDYTIKIVSNSILYIENMYFDTQIIPNSIIHINSCCYTNKIKYKKSYHIQQKIFGIDYKLSNRYNIISKNNKYMNVTNVCFIYSANVLYKSFIDKFNKLLPLENTHKLCLNMDGFNINFQNTNKKCLIYIKCKKN